MPSYLLEFYLPNDGVSGIAAGVRTAAGAMTRRGAHVRCHWTIAVTEDEVGFCLVEAPSCEIARDLAARAHVEVVRVATAIVN